MRHILMLLFLKLAWQNILARIWYHENVDQDILTGSELLTLPPIEKGPENAENTVSSDQDPILLRLENKTLVVLQLLSTNENIFDKLAVLQKDAQLAESLEKWQESTEGPELEEMDERQLENYVKIGDYYNIEWQHS